MCSADGVPNGRLKGKAVGQIPSFEWHALPRGIRVARHPAPPFTPYQLRRLSLFDTNNLLNSDIYPVNYTRGLPPCRGLRARVGKVGRLILAIYPVSSFDFTINQEHDTYRPGMLDYLL